MLVIKRFITLSLLSLSFLFPSALLAEEEQAEIVYIEMDPVIITNYQRESGKKPRFVQFQASIAVYGKSATDAVEKHLPLVRDTIVEFLGFTKESVIKDISKRQELRQQITDEVNKRLEEVAGYPYVEELVITHFMWD